MLRLTPKSRQTTWYLASASRVRKPSFQTQGFSSTASDWPEVFLGKIEVEQAAPGLGFRLEHVDVEDAVRVVGDHRIGHAIFADPGGQGAGVDAAQPMMPRAFSQASRCLSGTIVRRVGDIGLEDDADCAVAGRRRQVLDVLVIGADIADMREGEGDDLAEIGGVGEDFLVAGQRRVEHDFGLGSARGANSLAFDDGAIGKNEEGGRLFGGPGLGAHIAPFRQ
jgi:hypothetical protein